jgi:heat shock protein HslJ
MSLPARLLTVLVLCLPAWAAAAEATPPRRGADPALVRRLQSNLWTLHSGTEASGQPVEGLMVPGHAFTLRFQDARVLIQGGCNTMNGGWRLSPRGPLMIDRLAATMKACDSPLMKADSTLSMILAQPLNAELQPGDKPALRLLSPTRQTLVFSGQATPEALYGKATRIFLEVGPQTVSCQPGAGAPTQCLQVRERRFDAQGLRIEPPGEWRIFHGGIEGYAHQSGVRNVLRINRYTRAQPLPADASRYVYVLDLVVESETASK